MAQFTNGRAADGPVPVLLMVRELGIGGCENDLTKIAKGLDRGRFEPHVGCLHPNGLRLPQLKAAAVPILDLPVRGMFSRSWLAGSRKLAGYIRANRIQLVHTFDAPMDIVAIPVAWACRVPVLIKSHLWYRNMVRHHALMAATDRMVDAVVVNSRAVERDLIEHWGVQAAKTHLCYNGVDTETFHPAAVGQPKHNGPITIGTVCALRPEKRLEDLVAAFARLGKESTARLLIVGSGPMREALEQQARTLGVIDRTHFEPTTSDVAQWLRQIDVFVLSSASESFPNALLEAMASGCCVIASAVGGVPELVDHERNGMLFDAGNVAQLAAFLATTIADAKMRSTLGAEAARTARERFSLERNVRCIEDLYSALLAARRAGRVAGD